MIEAGAMLWLIIGIHVGLFDWMARSDYPPLWKVLLQSVIWPYLVWKWSPVLWEELSKKTEAKRRQMRINRRRN